ncbi:MAG: hypothetical protein ABSD92_10535 [Candidatus Bathyarchaeia archaeon]|jgi:hypothetical protein
MKGANKAEIIAKYVQSIKDFKFVDPEIPYYHMGATIADAILQSGLNYKTVVKPRIDDILEKYPEAQATSAFLKLLTEEGPNKILRWNNSEKPNRVIALTNFFVANKIESENDLKAWLEDESHISSLKDVRGVGNKTVDYLRILSGIKTNAIDRHLLNFISQAGIEVDDYSEANQLINEVADFMGKDKALLDHSIWKYMSEKRSKHSRCGD